jgi:Flp pilus assembly protein TadG
MIQPGQKRIGTQPPRNWRSRLRGEAGSTLVETALSITILLVLVIGIMDACLMVYSYHFISNAAREGTRYAIVRGNTWTQSPWNFTGTCASYTSAGCVATIGNIQDYVKSLSFPGIDPSEITVTPTSYIATGGTNCPDPTKTAPDGSVSTDTSQAPACNARGNVIEVNVQYRFATFIPFVPSRFLTMSSTSRMLISQ